MMYYNEDTINLIKIKLAIKYHLTGITPPPKYPQLCPIDTCITQDISRTTLRSGITYLLLTQTK